jgi:hypothetical protein
MKETLTSLRAYFGVVSLLGLYGNGMVLTHSAANTLGPVLGLIGLAFSIAYLLIAIRQLLARSPQVVTSTLWASLGFLGLNFLLSLVTGFQIGELIRAAIGTLIILYLLANTKRLATEAKRDR